MYFLSYYYYLTNESFLLSRELAMIGFHKFTFPSLGSKRDGLINEIMQAVLIILNRQMVTDENGNGSLPSP